VAAGIKVFKMLPTIILVEPQLGQNIGKAARAMLNFGLKELRLVSPRKGWLSKEARMLAAGADLVLDQAKCFDTFEKAIADLNHIYATSARPRDMIKEVFTPQRVAEIALSDYHQQLKVGFLFGPERTGLHNDHIARADALISIPVNAEFSSLNLAQAVVVVAYEWYQALMKPAQQYTVLGKSVAAEKGDLEGFLSQLETALEQAGYFRTENKRPLMARNLKNMFSRVPLTAQEVRTLRGVVSTLVNPNGVFSRKSKRG
jgi:tRNA/rRNA methyltransferase